MSIVASVLRCVVLCCVVLCCVVLCCVVLCCVVLCCVVLCCVVLCCVVLCCVVLCCVVLCCVLHGLSSNFSIVCTYTITCGVECRDDVTGARSYGFALELDAKQARTTTADIEAAFRGSVERTRRIVWTLHAFPSRDSVLLTRFSNFDPIEHTRRAQPHHTGPRCDRTGDISDHSSHALAVLTRVAASMSFV